VTACSVSRSVGQPFGWSLGGDCRGKETTLDASCGEREGRLGTFHLFSAKYSLVIIDVNWDFGFGMMSLLTNSQYLSRIESGEKKPYLASHSPINLVG
jgi:hypothetical protein